MFSQFLVCLSNLFIVSFKVYVAKFINPFFLQILDFVIRINEEVFINQQIQQPLLLNLDNIWQFTFPSFPLPGSLLNP